MARYNDAEYVRDMERHSQHEILLPARLTAAHRNGCALDILHLQGHVCVKFLCKSKSISISHDFAIDYLIIIYLMQ